jgi:hypothetical protein
MVVPKAPVPTPKYCSSKRLSSLFLVKVAASSPLPIADLTHSYSNTCNTCCSGHIKTPPLILGSFIGLAIDEENLFTKHSGSTVFY